MRPQSLLAILLLFLAAGCTGPKPEFYWYQPDKTLAEVKADYSECESKAREEAAKAVEEEYFDQLRSPNVLAGGDKAKVKKGADPALQAKADWARLYQQNALAGCMQSRGYVRLRAHQVTPDLKTRELPLGAIAGK